MSLCSESHKPIDGMGYPLTSTEFKLELELPDDVPSEVIAWLKDHAIKVMGAQRRVLGVSLLVKYKTTKTAAF